MSEEGPVAEAPASAMASATDHELSSHNQPQIQAVPNPRYATTSRKSTLNKSEFNVQVGGTQTPMSGMAGNRTSRHALDLDDYFVSLSGCQLSDSVEAFLENENETHIQPSDRSPRSGQTLQAPIFHADAWLSPPSNDPASPHGWRLGNMHNLYIETRA